MVTKQLNTKQRGVGHTVRKDFDLRFEWGYSRSVTKSSRKKIPELRSHSTEWSNIV